MPLSQFLKYIYLAQFSQPESDRQLYRVLRGRRAVRIVELGIGSLQRAVRMIELAQGYADGGPIHYTGMDLFEDRPSGREPLSLVEAHRTLKPTRAQIRLVPGKEGQSVARTANLLLGTDLLLISADTTDPILDAAWFYIPRMLHDGSLVLREQSDGNGGFAFTCLAHLDIAQRANRCGIRRAA